MSGLTYYLTGNNNTLLVGTTFNAPGAPINITGFVSDDRVYGIAIRPANGLLYAVTRTDSIPTKSYLYTLNPVSGVLTLINELTHMGMEFDISATEIAVSFNGAVDRMRIVTVLNGNFVINPDDATVFIATPISGAGDRVDGIAYDATNVPLAPQLYDLGFVDFMADNIFTLFKQNNNGGVLSDPVPTNIPARLAGIISDVAFDISSNGVPIVAWVNFVDTIPTLRLYQLNLLTGDSDIMLEIEGPGLIAEIGFAVSTTRVPCLHPYTLVSTPGGNVTQIESLRSGDKVFDFKGREIRIKANAKFSVSDNFYIIRRNAISANCPENDIIIRGEHPILYKGKESDAIKLRKKLGKDKVEKITLNAPVPVYSLVTLKRTFVMMEGVPVGTWEEEDLKQKLHKFPCEFL